MSKYDVISHETGEVRTFTVNEEKNQSIGVITEQTQTQKDNAKKAIEKRATRKGESTFGWFQENNGGFIFMNYVKNELLFNELGLDQANISRVVYLATYIELNGENRIVKKGQYNKDVPMSRNEIKGVMGLSDRAFENFWKDIKDNGILIDNGNKIFSLNEKYFKKGDNKGKYKYKKGEYTRIYINTTRELYKGTVPRKHKILSKVFMLVPRIDYKTNMILDDNGEPLTIETIAELLDTGKDRKSIYTLEKDLSMFEVNELPLFAQIRSKVYNQYLYAFVINPNIIYGGDNYEEIKESLNKMIFDRVDKTRNKK